VLKSDLKCKKGRKKHWWTFIALLLFHSVYQIKFVKFRVLAWGVLWLLQVDMFIFRNWLQNSHYWFGWKKS